MDETSWVSIAALTGLQIAALSTVLLPSRLRRPVAGIMLLGYGAAVGVVIGRLQYAWCVGLGLFSLFQLINIARITENRVHEHYLRRVVWRSGMVLLVLAALTPFIQPLIDAVRSHDVPVFAAAGAVVAIGGLLVLITTVFHILATRARPTRVHFADDELPTLSVLIPARNEDEQLSDCLHTLMKSDYPKLEVIVLDDCSQDSSSDIIKRFAHAGVRFIQGDVPKEGWLAKNQAYETLAEAASGEVLLFSGVDVRFAPGAFRRLVTVMKDRELRMASVLPMRTRASLWSRLFFPMRYWWELAVPRNIVDRPAVLSTCWIIERAAFQRLGGFAAVSHSIVPETYFARELYRKNAYEFLRTDRDDAAVVTTKELGEQFETAVRTRYPQLHKRIESVVGLLVAMFFFWSWPFVGLVMAMLRADAAVTAFYAFASASLILSNGLVSLVTNKEYRILSALIFPYSVLQEMALIFYSMYKYEFSEVIWKGRNVCYPVMHIVPRLPGLDEEATRAKRHV